MATTTTRPIRPRSQLENRVSSPGPSISLTRVIQPQTLHEPVPDSGGRTEETGDATQPARSSASSGQPPFWRQTLHKVINICSVLGVLLGLIFGIYAWVAQDKSIAIAKESELVTLALSCTDEKIKDTAVCQQFLDKYPDGPEISRRGNISVGNFYHEELQISQSVHMDFQYTAVYLALMNQLLQEQNTRFQSALDNTDPKQSRAQVGDIDEVVRGFLQDMKLVKRNLTMQRVAGVSHNSPASLMLLRFGWIPPLSFMAFLACVILYRADMDFVILLGICVFFFSLQDFWVNLRRSKG
ncbi:hypothetical protein RRF57_002486 [Xylaria bambusicola]|uniref:Uncharacterized protein n=1 Tax=Xylaria bambusicola TaxID=326684 RepID=A0AAN7UKE1_9PEZI